MIKYPIKTGNFKKYVKYFYKYKILFPDKIKIE